MTLEAPTTHLAKNNESSVFYRAIGPQAEPNEAWRLAMEIITNRTGCPDEAARGFLDSCYGGHFTEDVAKALLNGSDLAAAVDHVIARWMERPIDEQLEDELGIPSGLPSLTGIVLMHQALLEIAADERASIAVAPRRALN